MRFQVVVFVVTTSAFVVGEIPPSNSYLPPSPANRNTGYPQGARPAFPEAPQVIAARTLEQAGRAQGNGFSRSSKPDNAVQGRLAARDDLGYDENSALYGINEIEAKSTVSYEADKRGFQPQVSYKDTENLARSGGYEDVANTRNHGNGYQNGRNEDTRAY